MISWQARTLEIYLRLMRLSSGGSGELDVARERSEVESMASLFKPFEKVACEPVDADGVPAEWITPPGALPGRVMLFIHGGSFNAGSILSHRTLAGNAAIAASCRALLIAYRLAPEHPFPAAIDDCLTAYKWLLAQGYAPDQIVPTGDSAGGNLVLELLLRLRDASQPRPAAGVCLSPAPDLTFSGASWDFNAKKDLMLDKRKERRSIAIYLREVDPRSPLASPSFADLHGLPPLLLQVGSYEVLQSDVVDFAAQARAAGVDVTLEVWPGMQHEWQFAAKFLPEGRQAIIKLGAFVEAIFRSQPAPAS